MKPGQTLLAVLLAWTVAVAAAPAEEILLGSVAMDVPAEMVRRLTPLTEYLSRSTGLRVGFRPSPNLGSAVNDLGRGVTQIAYLTPVAYIEAREKYNARPLVAPLTHGRSTFHLVIAVRRDSTLGRPADLRGRRFAFGDPGALLQRAVVAGSGIRLEELGGFEFLRHYDNIAKAVLNGDFDAGILKDTLFEEFAPRGLRQIHVSPPLPGYLFAVSGSLPPETAARLEAALLGLRAENPAHRAILNALDRGYDGFVRVEDRDYDIVRKLIAPFRAP